MRCLSNNVTLKILLLTLGFTLFSIFTAQTNTMILWFVFIGILSIMILYKNKDKIVKKDIVIAIILGLLVMLSNIFMGFFVILAYHAAVVILKDTGKEIVFYNNKKRQWLWTIGCIFIIGGLLAIINVFLANQNYESLPPFQLSFLFNALNAGIFEEIFFRMFLFAICVKVTNNASFTKIQTCLCYVLMVLPHVLLHFSSTIELVSVLILFMLFGLPFALMQRKLNLLSAMGAHFFVDFIRFIVIGM